MSSIGKNYEIMQTFTLEHIPGLDTCILGALELFQKNSLPKLNFPIRKKILVVGSGNALVTGRIIFEKNNAFFANESTYEFLMKKDRFDFAVLISASGGKHAPKIAKSLKEKNIHTFLFTNNPDAKAKKYVDDVLVFPKQREPYTYNTSTYLGMILSKTRENPKKIYRRLVKLEHKRIKDFSRYDSFIIILPSKFDSLKEMFHTKFDELFGPEINGEIFTIEQMKHAKTVVTKKTQLFISLGAKNNFYGEPKNRLYIPLPRWADYGTVMSFGYYIIGRIQDEHPPYFKKNLVKYTKKISKIFNEEISPIIE